MDAVYDLDDTKAIRVLRRVMGDAAETAPSGLRLTPELRDALAAYLGAPVPGASGGDLARASLLLLADDPEFKPQLIEQVEQARGERSAYDFPSSVAIVTLAVCALQTQVDISWDRQNGLRLALKKRSASDALIRQFLTRLLGYHPGKAARDE
jgi:hypothetical protein